jgi:lipopolysaccharide/colanic/teichoic acid biosynthesis glycosyltransferase
MKRSKRLFDIVCVIPGLIVLLPLGCVIGLAIWLEDRGPIIFKQERVGFRGVPFKIWKFRTMVVNAERLGKQLTVGRDPRITRVGALLRQTKLDELPQLVNVFLGEMSLVGPRPEVPRYVALYSTEQARVLELMPGITDLASIEYRDENQLLATASDPERLYVAEIMPTKIRINLEYAQRASVLNDLRVIALTFAKVFFK